MRSGPPRKICGEKNAADASPGAPAPRRERGPDL
jgi:hypothetical protein